MKKIKFALLTAVIALSNNASAELSTIQQQVLDDNIAMKSMIGQARMEFRLNLFKNKDAQYVQTYRDTVKQMRTDGMLAPIQKNIPESNGQNRNPNTEITYDTGVTSRQSAATRAWYGNIFNSAYNADAANPGVFPVETSGSITMVTLSWAAISSTFSTGSFAIITNLGAATPAVLGNSNNLRGVGMNTFAVSANYSNGPFFVGVHNFGTLSAVALDENSVNSQGFHAATVNDGGGFDATSIVAITDANAIIRVSGNVTLPVELMNFSIE